ncbi:MAG: phosphorylase kinase alpha/beta subunit [archaeon GW2011_AR13]|nr:MAG: phosphorylase kinase alpha/beta subunit [archaeon GW2011_AR13]HIG94652.1 glycoside hydrolase family 15 [Nanoarchaeota archaeon]HIH63448.1 glycoside hydrolase family 15 [Nanoarchaeota archaeon]HIJ09378.1 glycoside hydrolase family 15 [Nanoarchaeota archaeon]
MKLKGRGKKLNRKSLIKQHLKILSSLKFKSGLFSASKKTVSTGYDKAWLRDNFYECIAFEVLDDWNTVKTTYRAILEIFKKHEFKIDYAISKKPAYTHQYIHARYNPETFDEFWEEWGNKQNDSIGCILFKIGELESAKKIKILENEDDFRVVQKLVDYLSTLEYWHDPDSGMWEENEEVHASSVGACVAGLEMIKNVKGIYVNEELIKKGYDALEKLLPRESEKKFVDLALLSLIWPYDVLNKKQIEEILKNIEYHLLKKKGVIRYKGDHYYNKNLDNFSEEAEWTFGLSWLSIIYDKLGKRKKAKDFLEKAIDTINDDGEVPELYFSNSDESNANSPLGWSESLFITALYSINKSHIGMKDEKLKKVVKKK